MTEMPALSFFRETPPDILKHPPLASSLQAFETSLFLVGLSRFPSALVTCGNALESVIKAKLTLPYNEGGGLEPLLHRIRSEFPSLKEFDQKKLDRFRRKRNHVAHYGFSPKDDEECAVLLLETGFPFLKLCYEELFDFFLDWRDIRPESTDFDELNLTEMAKAGLLPDVARQLRNVWRVYDRAQYIGGIKLKYCFRGFIYYIRDIIKTSALSRSDAEIIFNSEEKWQADELAKEQIKDFYDNITWEFDCPSCGGPHSLVAELNEDSLELVKIVTERCQCVQCGFNVKKEELYLSQVLLDDQLAQEANAIYEKFGIKKN